MAAAINPPVAAVLAGLLLGLSPAGQLLSNSAAAAAFISEHTTSGFTGENARQGGAEVVRGTVEVESPGGTKVEIEDESGSGDESTAEDSTSGSGAMGDRSDGLGAPVVTGINVIHSQAWPYMDSHGGEHYGKKSRKPYTLTKQRESWSNDEHERFIKALQLYNRDWKKIETYVGTKTVVQIRSHAQKYFQKQLHQQRSAALASAPALKGAACCDSDELNQQQPGRSQQETARSLISSDACEASAQLETARALVGGQHLQQVYLFLASMFSSPGADQAGSILQRLEFGVRECKDGMYCMNDGVCSPDGLSCQCPSSFFGFHCQNNERDPNAGKIARGSYIPPWAIALIAIGAVLTVAGAAVAGFLIYRERKGRPYFNKQWQSDMSSAQI
eukprot:gene7742-7941_t